MGDGLDGHDPSRPQEDPINQGRVSAKPCAKRDQMRRINLGDQASKCVGRLLDRIAEAGNTPVVAESLAVSNEDPVEALTGLAGHLAEDVFMFECRQGLAFIAEADDKGTVGTDLLHLEIRKGLPAIPSQP
ncbi:hypothetical protein [Singulisphaera sp. PoT]|uniref:hypothetical protein n=1 Tax=Singulisphaera sp. PoT TaxID=3411797 RepID=UPI003BF5D8EE